MDDDPGRCSLDDEALDNTAATVPATAPAESPQSSLGCPKASNAIRRRHAVARLRQHPAPLQTTDDDVAVLAEAFKQSSISTKPGLCGGRITEISASVLTDVTQENNTNVLR